VYEVFFIWQDSYGKQTRFDVPEYDLAGRRVLSFAGDYDRHAETFWYDTHPRGPRWAFLDWDFPGLRVGVQVEGRINDDSAVDKGWTAEVAFPWRGMHWLANRRSLPPKSGDVWRLFFGRFEALHANGKEIQPHPAWCWNRHGVYDTHRPECFTYIHFSDQYVDE
jgi:hypothetical protein